MLDEYGLAVLRGFDAAIADIGDRLRFCQPVISFEGDPTLYVARRLDWQDDRKVLAAADPAEANELGTLLPDTGQSIASGEGVVAVGMEFVQAANVVGVDFDHAGIYFLSLDGGKCWIGVATPECFANLKARLIDEARATFDEALGDAARLGHRLSERGDAALFLLRRCGPRRRDDLAIRQLAGALQNGDLDLYRRLLARFALELKAKEDGLHEKAERHIALAAKRSHRAGTEPSPTQEYIWTELRAASTFKIMPLGIKEVLRQQVLSSDDDMAKLCSMSRTAMSQVTPWTRRSTLELMRDPKGAAVLEKYFVEIPCDLLFSRSVNTPETSNGKISWPSIATNRLAKTI